MKRVREREKEREGGREGGGNGWREGEEGRRERDVQERDRWGFNLKPERERTNAPAYTRALFSCSTTSILLAVREHALTWEWRHYSHPRALGMEALQSSQSTAAGTSVASSDVSLCFIASHPRPTTTTHHRHRRRRRHQIFTHTPPLPPLTAELSRRPWRLCSLHMSPPLHS